MKQTLPASWVDRIFARLQGVYGREFTAQFSMVDQVTGMDIGIENAKQVWADELGMFCENPEAIKFALENLPDKSPNAIRFRELCRMMPRPQLPRLEEKLTAEQVEENKRRIREILQGLKKSNGNGFTFFNGDQV